MKRDNALDIVRDELEPFIIDDDTLYNKDPKSVSLVNDLNLSKMDLFHLSKHLDKYLSIELQDTHIKKWKTLNDVVNDVVKYSTL